MTKFEDIKGFIFDLDGVITDTAVFHTQAWHQIADEVGVQWNVQLGDALKGISRMDSLELILKHGNKETLFTEAEKLSLATTKNNNYLMLVQQMTSALSLIHISEPTRP